MINENLQYLWDNKGCRQTKTYSDGSSADILWRCSLTDNSKVITRVESVDYSMFVLGYANNYLPENFYLDYAVVTNPAEPTTVEPITTEPTTMPPTTTEKPVAGLNDIFENAVDFWNTYRDPANGFYCDFQMTNDAARCGDYSYWGTFFFGASSTGLGLVMDAIQAKTNLLTHEVAMARALEVRNNDIMLL